MRPLRFPKAEFATTNWSWSRDRRNAPPLPSFFADPTTSTATRWRDLCTTRCASLSASWRARMSSLEVELSKLLCPFILRTLPLPSLQGNLRTVTILIPDNNGHWMVQTCPVVKCSGYWKVVWKLYGQKCLVFDLSALSQLLALVGGEITGDLKTAVGIWIPNTWMLETFEYQPFWYSDFKWFGIQMVSVYAKSCVLDRLVFKCSVYVLSPVY